MFAKTTALIKAVFFVCVFNQKIREKNIFDTHLIPKK